MSSGRVGLVPLTESEIFFVGILDPNKPDSNEKEHNRFTLTEVTPSLIKWLEELGQLTAIEAEAMVFAGSALMFKLLFSYYFSITVRKRGSTNWAAFG